MEKLNVMNSQIGLRPAWQKENNTVVYQHTKEQNQNLSSSCLIFSFNPVLHFQFKKKEDNITSGMRAINKNQGNALAYRGGCGVNLLAVECCVIFRYPRVFHIDRFPWSLCFMHPKICMPGWGHVSFSLEKKKVICILIIMFSVNVHCFPVENWVKD